MKIKICEAETITFSSSDPRLPPLPPITQCKEGGWVRYADVTRALEGDLAGPDLTYTISRLCEGEYIVAPVYRSTTGGFCEWQGTWQMAKGQVVSITDSSATGYDFTFVPQDSNVPSVSISASPASLDLKENVVVTILADDDRGIARIWEKVDTVFVDGSSHPGVWSIQSVTAGMGGHTAGAQFSITDDRIIRAVVSAKVCDTGGNQRSSMKTIIWGGCDDGIQDHGEIGIDCGGPCPARCMNCLDDFTVGTNPSVYLYNPDQWEYIRSTALGALAEYANEQDIDYSELDTADEYIEAISWWVARHMGYRGDNINEVCLNDVLGLDYQPSDYEHDDFPVPAYYTLNYSGFPGCDGVTYTEDSVNKTWHADPTKWYYGDCEDYSILFASLLRSLGVSHSCIFSAEQPGHSFNIVYYNGKYRVLEPQGAEIGCKYYAPDNLWNDKIGAFACAWDNDVKVKPWEYTFNYAGCENPSVSAAGGGFGEKTLWLDWNGWGEDVKPAVADFNGDGKDDIGAVRSDLVGGGVAFDDFRFISSGGDFVKDFAESSTGNSEWEYFYPLSREDSVTGVQGTIEGGPVRRYGHVESPTANNLVTFYKNTHPVGDVDVSFSDETMPRLSIHDGWFSIEVTDVATYDHLGNVNRAPQLRTYAGSGDWTIETYARVSDTIATHHAGLMVCFSEDDIVYFGPYKSSGSRNEEVRIERTGVGYIDSRFRSVGDGYVKIQKVGTEYRFFYSGDGSRWTQLENLEIARAPIYVGFILKSWEPTNITAEFDYFKYSGASRNFTDNFDGALGSDWHIYIPQQTWHGSFCLGEQIPFVGDFDGDGFDDIITFNTERNPWEGDAYVALNQAEKYEFGLGLAWNTDFCMHDEIPGIGDFNGDGRDDIVCFNRSSGRVYVALSTKFGFEGERWQWNNDFCRGSNSTPLIGDFNGDGLDDIACVRLDGTRARIWVALANPSVINYYWPTGCNQCNAATFYTKAYYEDVCP